MRRFFKVSTLLIVLLLASIMSVYAEDLPAQYRSTIETYISELSKDFSNSKNRYNIDELGGFGGGAFTTAGLDKLGYTTRDINGDGIPELFLGSLGFGTYAAIYTLENNTPKKLVVTPGGEAYTILLGNVPGHPEYTNCIQTVESYQENGTPSVIYKLNGTTLQQIASFRIPGEDLYKDQEYRQELVLTPFSQYKPITSAPEGSIYRLFNRTTGEHLYTPDFNEASYLSGHGWTSEDVGWTAPLEGTAVYRLFNPAINDHLYTTDTNEYSVIVKQGWIPDNGGRPLFYSGGSIPIYRLYNPTTKRHHLTKDENEYNVLPGQGWSQEGAKLSAVN